MNYKSYKINTLENGNDVVLYVLNEDDFKIIDKELDRIKTQADINRFIDRFKINPKSILLYGSTKMTKEERIDIKDVLNKIIPRNENLVNYSDKRISESYKCFCCKDFNVDEFTNHRTALDSFDCLLTKLRFPEYIIITENKAKTK